MSEQLPPRKIGPRLGLGFGFRIRIRIKIGGRQFSSGAIFLEPFTLKYLNLRFRFFECKYFIFITLTTSDRTRLRMKRNLKAIAWERYF